MTSQSASESLARRIRPRMTVLTCLSVLSFGLTGCLARSSTTGAAEPAPRQPDAERSPEGPPAAQFTSEAKLEVHSFAPGTQYQVSARKLRGQWPRVLSRDQVEAWRLPIDRQEVSWVILDEHPARYAKGRSLSLSNLINEDEELAPGFHWVSIIHLSRLNDPQPRLELSLQALAVESEPAGLPRAPGCALLWPVGTYNGDEVAREIEVLAVPRQGSIDRVVYEARARDWLMRGTGGFGASLRMKDAPSGDITVTATCSVGGERLPPVSQVITINRDAPEQDRAP